MLDPIEEAKFDELKGKFRDLKIPTPPEIMIGLKVHDKNGNLTFDDVQRGHSWTRNYWNLFILCIYGYGITDSTTFGPGHINKMSANGSFYGYTSYSSLVYEGYSTDTNRGIVVGTDNSIFNIEQYELGLLISHGVGTGQLSYATGTKVNSIYVGTTWTSTHSRVFNNINENAIIVRETGLKSGDTFLVERSVLDPEIELVEGSRLTVSYSFSSDFSAIDN